MTSPWRTIQAVEGPVNLLDITSEQLAESLHEREVQENGINFDISQEEITMDNLELKDTDSDAAIAYMLQDQYDRQHDLMITREENIVNGDAKVNISYSNYKINSSTKELPVPDIDLDEQDIDRFVKVEKEYASIPRCGYKKVDDGSKIITKHDILMSSRINACRLLQFPPGIHTGDTGGFDVKLNNKVFNSLREHSHAQYSKQKPKAKPHKP
ncbi:serine/threonine-protein kinase RIO3-like [Prorops nasuta]|uniref:serine/threonine-protein kinase RIO3-like n=1 Tax=Prorops nasuta TaxID=863751 RepID=UPI0034CFFE69